MRVLSRVGAAALFALGVVACSSETKTETVVTQEVPACSTTYPTGACETGKSCFGGSCVATNTLCSESNPAGLCADGYACYGGGCILEAFVPPPPPVIPDPCAAPVTTTQPTLAFSPAKPLGANNQPYTYDDDANPATPAVEVPYVQRAAITVSGLQFRDLNGNGTLDRYEDWRYAPICRARDLVTKMTVKQKIGLMSEGSTIGSGNDTGILTGGAVSSIAYDLRRQSLIRFSSAVTAAQSAAYLNNVQAMCEGMPLGIPFVITADPVHGIGQSTNATTGAQTISATSNVSQWPYPMGLGAINDPNVTFQYGDTVRQEFKALGFRWQLGPMADLATEPRWARVQNTFGENAFSVAKHTKACIEGFQAGHAGGLKDGIAATMKHFPGAGADDDGKDSHSRPGKYNVYPGGAFLYHSVSFQAAIDAGSAAVMPCYSIFLDSHDPEVVGAGHSHTLITDYLKGQMGFDGMITGDWGAVGGSAWGLETFTDAEKAASYVKAGSHQLGSDSHTKVQAAYDQGLLTDADIDAAAAKILEMSFKLGLFENPYSDPAAATSTVRSQQLMQAGFEAQKKALVLLKNPGASNGARLPILATRFVDKPGGTANVPDAGEITADTNGNGSIEVFFDGVVDHLSGTDQYSTFLQDYDYRAAGAGAPGVAGYALPIVEAADAATADIAVLRITARKGTYFGLDEGVPLSFDKPFPGVGTDGGYAAAVKDAHKVIDLFRIRDGYTDSAGVAHAATNPTLKIVLVMHMDRPGIVKPFVQGLKTLDETPGVAGSYPLVSDQANVNQTTPSVGSATAHLPVDAFLVDFGAYDRAVLDFLFAKNPIAGWTYGAARLPIEIPSSDEDVERQFEDLPADSWNPTYALGAGSNLPTN